jgi:ketosteroid isomerase-like protein
MNSFACISNKTSEQLQKFLLIYANFDEDTLNQLSTIYHDNAVFKDPIHELEGIAEITQYFEQMSKSLLSCEFDYKQIVENQDMASVFWMMRFRHKKLNSGNEIAVEGASLLEFEANKVVRHVDYYDLGAMLYEHIPVMGNLTTMVRKRLARD